MNTHTIIEDDFLTDEEVEYSKLVSLASFLADAIEWIAPIEEPSIEDYYNF